MNADPDEGQPTTVPEPALPAASAEEAEAAADEVREGEAEAASAEAGSAEAEAGSAEAEDDAEPDAAEDDAAEAEPEAAAPPAPPAAATPLVAGRYRLVSEIGGGAMGVVWRARDEVLGRDVAVKELRGDHTMSGAQVRISHQRARREGRIAARLQHPNAVVIYDVAEHDGRPYLIMEYVPSQSLGDILATGAVLTPTEVTSIGAQLASALTAAHERGIVHRDIKPGNVLMTADGTVKLTDFGISRAAGDATVTATGEILGTPAYTAPEVAQGHPVAFPADVFSLGATLYAAVEGTPPFGEDVNAMALLLRVVRNEIRQPKRSGPLTDTIMWMLSPDPADRPTMREVWQRLDGLSSAKALPVADIRPLPSQTRPFAAPSPTLVVDTAAAKGITVGPQPDSEPLPAAAAASAPLPTPATTPAPAPTRTPNPISSQVTAPTATPAATPASDPAATSNPAAISTSNSSALQAATPTSALVPTPTRDTSVAKSAAAKPPASTPPTSGRPAVDPTPPPDERPRSRMPLAIAVCAIGTAVLVVAIVVAMNAGSDKSPTQPVAHSSTPATRSSSPAKPPTSSANPPSSSQPSTTPSSTAPTTSSSSSPSTSPSSPTSPSTSASNLPADPAAFISNYYSLLPGNLTAAYPQMTTAYQTVVAGGFSGYQKFWNTVQQVSVSGATATTATNTATVVAYIHYVYKDGTTTTERTTFGLVKDSASGSWKINTSHPG
jgi:serine/threonine protein kinase